MPASINAYCHRYRVSKGATLTDVAQGGNIKTLSAFEHGKSSNINHLYLYIDFAIYHGEETQFIDGLIEVTKNG